MATYVVCIYILTTLIITSTTAEEKNTRLSFKHKAIIDLGANGSESSQNSQSLCSSSYYNTFPCWKGEPTLRQGFCATYSDEKNVVSTLECPYFKPNGFNFTTAGSILLPRNLSQLNNYMCGPLNRKGIVCSECADGFGPSVTSFGYRCVNCTDAWYGVPLILFVEFVPLTVFYLIVLIFQISITLPPAPCFITSAQFIVIAFDSLHKDRQLIITDKWELRLDMKIILTLYQMFNLDFFRSLMTPYCVSSKLKFIHMALLGYISAFYPIILTILTWICVELHGRNFRPLVWLWRPFHRSFVRLRRG